MDNTRKTAAWAAGIAGAMTLLAGLGALRGADLAASDALYQSRSGSDGEIALVCIDQRALEELGPYSEWDRDIFAQVLEALNASEDCRPAAIGLTVPLPDETGADTDQWLAQAAGEYGNVITASSVQLAPDRAGGECQLGHFTVLGSEEPYPALRRATVQGHVSAVPDPDGILRHHLLQITAPDGSQIPSMALAAARMYRAYWDEPSPALPPTDEQGAWYLPFCGVPGDFYEYISVVDLLSGDAAAEEFADRIVLIGFYAAGTQDSYVTAADHAGPMYGVEFQANAIQALLWESYKREVGDGPQLAVLFLLLLAAFAGFWRRKL